MRRTLLLMALALTFQGCFYLADRGRLLEGRVDKLSDENQQLAARLKDTQDRLDKAQESLKAALEQLDINSRTTGANIGVKVDAAMQEVASLRGQVETSQFKVSDLDQRLVSLEAAKSAAPKGADARPEEPKKVEPKLPDDPRDFLKLADDKLKGGDTELARKMFADFLKKWPRDELVGEAHAGLGEAWFADGKCPEALYDFGKVISEYKKTKSAPVVYLHSAECFRQARMLAEAKQVLEELVKDFPKSDAAKTAKTKLAEVEKDKKAPKKGGK